MNNLRVMKIEMMTVKYKILLDRGRGGENVILRFSPTQLSADT